MLNDIVQPIIQAIEHHWQRIGSLHQRGQVAGGDFRAASAEYCRVEIQGIVVPAYMEIVSSLEDTAEKVDALVEAHRHLLKDLVLPLLDNEGSRTIAIEGANRASQTVYQVVISQMATPPAPLPLIQDLNRVLL